MSSNQYNSKDTLRKSAPVRTVALLLVALLVAVPPPLAANAQPIYVGTWLGFSYPDPSVLTILQPLYDGMKAAIAAANNDGGVNGRNITLLECETGFNPLLFFECLTNWTTQYTDFVSTIALPSDDFLFMMIPTLQAMNVPSLAPNTGGFAGRYYDPHWAFVRAHSRLETLAHIKQLVNYRHLRRIALMTTPDVVIAPEKPAEFAAELALLGLELVYVIGVNQTAGSYMAQIPGLIAARPQAICMFGAANAGTADFVQTVLGMVLGGQLDSQLVITSWDALGAVTLPVFQGFQAYGINPTDRLYVSMKTPALTDTTYAAAARARAEMTAYFGNSNFLSNFATYHLYAFGSWLGAQLLIGALRNTKVMTRQGLMDSLFTSSVFEVDDILLGMYNGACTGQRTFMCECNQGYRTADLYTVDAAFNFVNVVQARSSIPFTQCSPESTHVPLPLVYAQISSNGTAAVAATAKMWLGKQWQESVATNAGSTVVVAGRESTTSGATTDPTTAAAAVTALYADRYLSAVALSVVDPNAPITELPVVDPLVFPAALAPAFRANVLYLSATLQQEIFSLVSLTVGTNGWSCSIVARADDGAAIVDVFTKTVNNFGVEPVQTISMPSTSTLALPTKALSKATLVIGVLSATDVSTVVAYLQQNAEAYVGVAFSELSVLYDEFVMQATAAGVESRLIFATSMRNWAAPTLASNQASPLMVQYFAGVAAANTTGHPLTLRGFIASAAIQQIASVTSGALLTDNLLKAWYSASVIAVSATDFYGAFSNATCFSAADQSCATNVGARSMYVMALDDVTTNNSTFTSYPAATTFSSGRLTYKPLPTSSSLSTGVIVGIAVGAAAFVALLIALFAMTRPETRDNSNAPKDMTKPFTLIFTDIQSSTALWARAADGMATALETHHMLIRQLIKKYKCYEVKTIGDAFMIACKDANSALDLCVELQNLFFNHDWGTEDIDEAYREFELEQAEETGVPPPSANMPPALYRACWNGIRVRIGIHTGMGEIKLDEITKGYDYYGTVANVTARTESAGHGGQILVTKWTLAELRPDVQQRAVALGPVELKGVPDPVELFAIPTIPGRVFAAVRKEAPEEEEDSNKLTSDHQSTAHTGAGAATGAGASSSESIASMAQGLTRKKSSRVHYWSHVSAMVIGLLLSTSKPDARKKVIKACCDAWRVKAPAEVKGAKPPKRFQDDPMVRVMADRIGPMVEKKYGATTTTAVMPVSRRQSLDVPGLTAGEAGLLGVPQPIGMPSPTKDRSPSPGVIAGESVP